VSAAAKAAAVLLLGGALVACSDPGRPVEVTGPTMGTTYSVKVVDLPAGLGEGSLRVEVERVLEAVNASMSTYLADSELSRFNRSGDTAWTAASLDLVRVVAEAQRVSLLTGGAFDVTVGPLVNLWGFGPGRGEDRVPSEAEVAEARARVGHAHLQAREAPPAVRKAIPDLYVDLSAIAKGYGVDRVSERLEALGVARYLVEIGGEVRGRGANARGTPWKVAVERPADGARTAYAVVDVDGVGVATSGDYRNYFEKEGRRYSHTIYPATGRPIAHTLASVTVVSDTCMTADALATGLNVLGPAAGYALAEREGIAAFFIVHEGQGFTHRATPAFARYRGE
jgi:thiamine biosynthesis lipoprotein